ncbi:MAG: 4Fe-4S binding protein [Bacteroidales bacterium]|nr:4Fe-4S binding protein [Lentimicrobiaceae bacterium]MDD5694193.1 4Fe-4S binding protein [Bacteroidales bacterium]
MNRAWLKNIRVILAIVFFMYALIIFLDFAGLIGERLYHGFTFLQFTPSLIEFIHLLGATSLGFLVVILLTLVFGRIYCSTLCPAGVFQDMLIFLKRKIRKKERFHFLRARPGIRLAILGIVLLSVLAGSMAVLNLLDPYSLFGRITAELFRPLVIGINNLLASFLKLFHNFSIKPVEIRSFMVGSFLAAMFSLIVLVLFPLFRGRQYCNTLCPVGTILGYLSKFSLYRITLDKSACTQCGECMFTCKAGCINIKKKEVDLTRCVACFNCLNVCSLNGVRYAPVWKKATAEVAPAEPDLSKRNFLLTSAILLGSLVTVKGQPGHRGGFGQGRHLQGGKGNDLAVSPPGSLSHQHFTSACTGCYLCVSACPTQVLQPSLASYGWEGLFQPVMDYRVSFCNYDCVVCSQACPTGAILPLTTDAKKEVQVGIARFIKRECIVFTKNTACGACSEHCPTKAVNMVPYKYGLTIPEVTPSICVGCGACEYACPTDPKAIVVDANPVHLKARLPVETENGKGVDYKEEFPF